MRVRSGMALILLVVLGLLVPANAAAFVNLPPGFVDEPVVGGVPQPTAIAWLPTGDLLITTQAGVLYRWSGGSPQPVLDLTAVTCLGGETGLLGVAVHPNFQERKRYIYLYYTHRQGPDCQSANRANRVSQFRMDESGAVGNERVLIDHIPATNGNHNAGDLQFDKQGLLYISVGEAGVPNNARRLDILSGKILRITPNGGIPDTNPFRGAGTTSCSATGQAQARSGKHVEAQRKHHRRHRHKRSKHKHRHRQNPPPSDTPTPNPGPDPGGTICQEIFATGLRNPFRMAFDPNDGSAQQRFFINDVGQTTWEEIDVGRAGADYGWPIREGPCPIGTTTDCTPDSRFVDPIFAYDRTDGCTVITGGAVVPQSAHWPSAYANTYLFADLGCGTIFALRNETPGQEPEQFGTGTGAIDLQFGPDGALYYTTYEGGGQVRRIVAPG